MYNRSPQDIKKDLRKKELNAAFKVLKNNAGGPVTFHYTKEVQLKNGKHKIITNSTKIVNLSPAVLKYRNLSDLLILLRSMQSDLSADYFTI